MACQSRGEIQVQASRRRLLSACSSHSTRPSPRAWAWAYLSAARSSKPTADGCGRPGANRRVLSFSLRSPLTEPPSVIDVAYWHFSEVTGRADDFRSQVAGVKRTSRLLMSKAASDPQQTHI